MEIVIVLAVILVLFIVFILGWWCGHKSSDRLYAKLFVAQGDQVCNAIDNAHHLTMTFIEEFYKLAGRCRDGEEK